MNDGDRWSKEPLTVLCPSCLAKPGRPCRSIVSWNLGIKHGRGTICKPHAKRRARAMGLRVVKPEER